MAKADVWPTIHTERKALAADLEGLNSEDWAKPTWCDQWTVQDVVAHMTATARITPPAFVGKLVGSGFSLQKMQEKDIAAIKGATPDDTLAAFRSEVESTKHPPGPVFAWLGETVIHSDDIRRPLGLHHDYPTDAVVQVADFYKGSNLIVGAKRRIAGLSLRATDTEWSHGAGPEVSGPILALVMAMTGRKGALDDLSGEGVEQLRQRA
jgi:uncharacterized protein (TIGR03083 family)